MCTAISFKTKDHYFGRNLDLEYSYHETVTITPRNYIFKFHNGKVLDKHFALIGMAFVQDNYPLYYDATNEKGLSMAGLNFPEYARYQNENPCKINVAPYEFIPFILSQCSSVKEARALLENINLVQVDFSPKLKAAPLHWILSDKYESITIEPMFDGLKIYDNPVGVLTNNPPFYFHMLNLTNYMGVTREEITNRFAENIDLKPYSRGMGSFGLPGDLSSASRFVKAAFTKLNSVTGDSESESISQFFHILNSVNQQKGCCRVNGKFEFTIYSSCCNTDKGIYYYTTYENSQITAVNMHHCDLESNSLITYELIETQQIKYQN